MNKYTEISMTLQDELQNGVYPAQSRFPSEGELADRFAVSTITVNRAVERLVQLGFLERSGSRRGGTVVRAGKKFPRGLIGIVTDLGTSFHNRVMAGAMSAAYNDNYALCPLPYDPDLMEMWLKQLKEGSSVAGILTLSAIRLTVPLPTVYIDKTNLDHYHDLCQVRCDSYSGGKMIADFLLREGHREIVYFHIGTESLEDVPRRHGFLNRLREAGIPSPESRIFSVPTNSTHSYCRALETARRRFPDFSALACETDYDAFEMLRAGRKINMDIGRKIRLTGFGNVQEIQRLTAFPTIEQHPEETGYRACLKLLEMLHSPAKQAVPFLEELPVELIASENNAQNTTATR